MKKSLKTTTSKQKYGPALDWDKLADAYDETHYGNQRARTQPMDKIFNWAEKQVDKYYVDPKKGTIHRILK